MTPPELFYHYISPIVHFTYIYRVISTLTIAIVALKVRVAAINLLRTGGGVEVKA